MLLVFVVYVAVLLLLVVVVVASLALRRQRSRSRLICVFGGRSPLAACRSSWPVRKRLFGPHPGSYLAMPSVCTIAAIIAIIVGWLMLKSSLNT